MTDVTATIFLQSAPWELQAVIPEFWPDNEYHTAARIAYLESGFNPFALADTTGPDAPCNTPIGERDGVQIYAERSVGYFQINACTSPQADWTHLYNARRNAEAAYQLWLGAGRAWTPWYFSARRLGLI